MTRSGSNGGGRVFLIVVNRVAPALNGACVERASSGPRVYLYDWGREDWVRHLHAARTSTKIVIGVLWLLAIGSWANYMLH